MNTATIIALLPYIIQLIQLAEKLFAESGQGADKKSFVTTGIKTAIETVTAVSTGGQKNTWDSIAPIMGGFIDSTVSLFFPKVK